MQTRFQTPHYNLVLFQNSSVILQNGKEKNNKERRETEISHNCIESYSERKLGQRAKTVERGGSAKEAERKISTNLYKR